jgi:hypothetical protein
MRAACWRSKEVTASTSRATGAEFDSLDAAVHAAARSAAEIDTSRLARGDTSDVVIEVRDEQNQRTVTASMQIERHNL